VKGNWLIGNHGNTRVTVKHILNLIKLVQL